MGKQILFYNDKPLFGLDIGHDSLRIMQTKVRRDKSRQVIGYGMIEFDPTAIIDGVIEKPEPIAAALHELTANHMTGKLTTRRVAMAIPAYRTFSRGLQLPLLEGAELEEAIRLEAEQYISVPLKELYLDYSVVNTTAENCEVYMVAVPRRIVDSHLALAEAAGLEVVAMETTVTAGARLFATSNDSDITTALVDFGALSGSISLYDKTTLVTGTMPVGGKAFTDAIQSKLDLTVAKAEAIKTKYGLNKSKWQKDILSVAEPVLSQVVAEIRRTLRYYEDRYGTSHRIGQIVMLGGGSNMPGLSDYLTNALRLPVRVIDPWIYLQHDGLQEPRPVEQLTYSSVAGLSLMRPEEIFAI